MGRKGFYPWLKKKRGCNPTPRHPIRHCLPDGDKIRVDVPACLSEAYWAREAWPLLKELLTDVDGITMVDGEKHGHESTKRNGQNRRLDQEGQNLRKPGGNKLDLAARDLVNQRDWLVGEAKKEWDELGTNFLREVGVKLFKQLHLVAEHRLQENGTVAFKDKSRFFAFFSGGK